MSVTSHARLNAATRVETTRFFPAGFAEKRVLVRAARATNGTRGAPSVSFGNRGSTKPTLDAEMIPFKPDRDNARVGKCSPRRRLFSLTGQRGLYCC